MSPSCQLSLRAVIAAICCACTIGVGVTTLVVTYALARRSLIDIGRQYAASLATSVRIKAQDYFDIPVTHVRALQKTLQRPGVHFPSDDPDMNASNVPYERDFATVVLTSNLTYPTAAVYFEDGSLFAVYPDMNNTELRVRMTNQYNTIHLNQPLSNSTTTSVTVADMQPTTVQPIDETYLSAPDLRPTGWSLLAPLALSGGRSPIWLPVRAASIGYQQPDLIVTVMGAALNASGVFIGLTGVILPFSDLSNFLQSLPMTPNAAGFMLNDQGIVMGSSLKGVSISTHRTVPLGYVSAVDNCFTTGDSIIQKTNTLLCATLATQMPYAPLRVAATTTKLLQGDVEGVVAFKVGSETYYGVAPKVANGGRVFGVLVTILLPEQDLTGDLNTARDVTIAICVCVVVVAALVALGGVRYMLQPLRVLAERMGRTAKLQLQARAGVKYVESNLWEIQALQRAYEDMHKAVDSFTRYVPRDVVRDLMQTGQLCEIGMTPMQCTMMFADIAGFTSICERVPAARLGAMITAFFETASQLVMSHGGLVDKFIGDCVMAVWGAPFACRSMQAKAALCALRMSHSASVEPLTGIFDREGELLSLRVGVNAGEVLAGNMGSAQRMSYTVIGDAVNLAARLEGLNKKFGTRVLLSEFVVGHADLGDASGHANDYSASNGITASAFLRPPPVFAVMGLIVTRLLGRIRVVGKEDAVHVYEAVGLTGRDPQEDDGADASDGSLVSGFSTMSHSLGSDDTPGGRVPARKRLRRAAALRLSKLVTQALHLTEAPLRCSDAVRSFCAAYSAACALYCQGRPEECLAALRALEAFHPAFVPAGTASSLSLCALDPMNSLHTGSGGSSQDAGSRLNNTPPPAVVEPSWAVDLLAASVPVSMRLLAQECEAVLSTAHSVGESHRSECVMQGLEK